MAEDLNAGGDDELAHRRVGPLAIGVLELQVLLCGADVVYLIEVGARLVADRVAEEVLLVDERSAYFLASVAHSRDYVQFLVI